MIEFELTVYLKNRINENMDEFLEEYWIDRSFLSDESHEIEFVFRKLCKQISWGSKEDFDISISGLMELFRPKFKKRQPYLKKYSYVEFLHRDTDKKSRKHSPNNLERPMTYLSSKNKYSTLELSRRKFKIIDYGNCYDYSDERYGLINTRQYRAPEVILSEI